MMLVWRGWVRGGGSLLHQCPDSSPAAYNPVAFDIVTVVSWLFHISADDAFPLSKTVFPFQTGDGESVRDWVQQWACKLSQHVKGGRYQDDQGWKSTIVWRSIKMCPGSNIFQLFPRTGAGKQVGGFWELGGRLGGTGFKGSSGNLAMGLLIGGSPNMSIHILKKVTKLAFGAKSVVIWALSLNNRV